MNLVPCNVLYTIIDIETTGNGLKGNKITEISIFKFDGEKVIDEFTSLVNPQCPIPFFITGLTGINDQMVARAPTFEVIANKVYEITKDCIFVAHAVNFDYGVIKEEFRHLGISYVRKKLCTVRLSRKLIPGLQSYSLGKLCSAIGITITARHRARGDAEATVSLFQHLLKKPKAEKVIQQFLNTRSQEATLPPHLDGNVVNNIPQKAGIYYFLNKKKDIIYVGKAKNLKKRVLSHFYDKSDHERLLCSNVIDIDYELSGGELIALLMESAAIKQHFPKFNRAQKKATRRYGIFSYEDRMGILHLAFADVKKVPQPLAILENVTECRTFLRDVSTKFKLCPKYCQLIPIHSNTFSCNPVLCPGICANKESVEQYNLRVDEAITSMRPSKEQIIIKLPGRTADENAFVLVENGMYCGYGFIPNDAPASSKEKIKAFLIPQKNTIETQRLVNNELIKKSNLKTVEL